MKNETVTLSREQAIALAYADASNGASASQLVDGWRVMAELRAALAELMRPTNALHEQIGKAQAAMAEWPQAWQDSEGLDPVPPADEVHCTAHVYYDPDSPVPAEQEECTHDFRMFMSECAKCGEPYKADPVPPAGGEVEVLGWVVTDMNGDFYFAANRQTPGDVALVDRVHVTRLQAEVAQKSEAFEVAKGMLQERVKQCSALQAELTKARELLIELDKNWNAHDGESRFSQLMREVELIAHQSAPAAKDDAP